MESHSAPLHSEEGFKEQALKPEHVLASSMALLDGPLAPQQMNPNLCSSQSDFEEKRSYFVGVLMTHRRLWTLESCRAACSGLGTRTSGWLITSVGINSDPTRRAMWTPGQGSHHGLLLEGIAKALWHSWLILGLIRRDQPDGSVGILVHVLLFLLDSPLEQTVALIIAKYDIIRLYFLGARWGNRLIRTAFVSK